MQRAELIAVLAILAGPSFGCADRVSDPVPPPVDYPAVVAPDGSVIEVEVAGEPMRRARGLMYRSFLPDDRGMIFIFPEPGVETFWMKNTLIPLDMIWLDEDLEVVWIERDVPPCEADPCPSYGSESVVSKFVLELAAGGAQRYGIVRGSVLKLRNIDPSIAR